MPQVVVIGAGISGLAAATFLEGVEVAVLEASDKPGGKVQTLREHGRAINLAANGWLDSEPAMGRLLERAGLADQVVRASERAKQRWIFADGQLHEAPLGPLSMATTRLIPFTAKLRMLLELFVGRGAEAKDPSLPDTETVGDWVGRRLGRWFVERMVGPMVAGIYAADPYAVSLRAAFPRMHELERDHRSLFLAMLALRRGGQPPGKLTTLPGGAGTLTETLAERLGAHLRLGVAATAIEPAGHGWRVHTAEGTLQADAVVLACPAPVAARLISDLEPEAAEALKAIPYSPVTVVASSWAPGSWEREPTGFGVLVARDQDLGGVLGTLFTSCMFPAQAPEGEVLLRTMVGGGVAPEAAAESDEALIAKVRAAHARFFGTEQKQALAWRIFRHPQGIPAYHPGHLGRVAQVREAEVRRPGLFFVGNHLSGIGVKDCARDAETAAKAVRTHLATRAPAPTT